MFEILTKEQVEKMSDRELGLSEYYYRHNLNQITLESYERSKNTTSEPITEDNNHVLVGAIDNDGNFVPKEKITLKTRGRKKKDK